MEVYILVHVHYDHFRFQKNYGVFEKALDAVKYSHTVQNLPIHTYQGHEDPLYSALQENGTEHWHIQNHIVNEPKTKEE